MVNYVVSEEELDDFVRKLSMFETTEHVSRFLRFVRCSTVPPSEKERDSQMLLGLAEQWKALATQNGKIVSGLIDWLFPGLDPAMDSEAETMDIQCPCCLHFNLHGRRVWTYGMSHLHSQEY